MEFDEQYDKFKTRVLKYVLFKKRTEKEVIEKFSKYNETKYVNISEQQLEQYLQDVIVFLKENKYIDDNDYIRRFVNENIALKNSSIKKLKFKLREKGVDKYKIEDYFEKNDQELRQYEIQSAYNILVKRKDKEPEKNIQYLLRNGYNFDNIKIAIDMMDE